MKMIDVDKIFLVKSNEGAVHVLNALKLCLYWKTVNEYVMDIYDDHFEVTLYEGNMFGSILAFIRRCKVVCTRVSKFYVKGGKAKSPTPKKWLQFFDDFRIPQNIMKMMVS